MDEERILNLLYRPLTLEIEFHLLNEHNKIIGEPLVKNLEQLHKFHNYIRLINFLRKDNINRILKEKRIPYYDINEVKSFIKSYYNVMEIYHNGILIQVRIKNYILEVR